ncbi:phage tail tape measure protein [Lysinibacillus sp. 2017]|uniref:phage tail tape measure protein n=1 Tax=unclassified Lysinibacillus TaxID=2636778 RepID=UPI000D52763E|nr:MULTISPECIES: phage tail tape measure protein [unclassified Lysinibacillus]AWE07889.1 phage tail tape measure protein [Lysinibacillus sp. 2017]TGN33163.1 phage tail tape measure protein [Lysinibacillus sp. S2017]
MAIDLVATLRLKDEMSGSLKKLAGAATVGFAAIGGAAVAATAKFASIDGELRRTASLSGATSEEFKLLTQAATEMGSNSTKSMLEISQSMSEIAANGMNANEVMSAMPGIIAASEASGESLAVAAETVSSALNIWSMEAEESAHVADVLAMAANVSAAGIDDMGYAFKYAGAPAAALGVSLEETAAAIAAITNNGIDGSTAGTALRASLLALNNPAKAQAKIMDQLGFSVTDAEGNFKSLSGMIGDIQKATEGMTEADKVATLGKLVGTEAVSGFLALVKAGPAELAKMTDALRDSDGLAEQTANDMNQGVGAMIKGIKSQFEAFAFQVGQALEPVSTRVLEMVKGIDFAPIVTGATELAEKLVNVFEAVVNNWPQIVETIKTTTTIVIGAGVAFATFKGIMAGMTIIGTINALMAAYRTGTLVATAAQMGLNTAMLLSPITWIVAGIALLVGAGVALALKWRQTAGSWSEVWRDIQKGAAVAVNGVIGLINGLIKTINLIPGVNIPIMAKVDWGKDTSFNTESVVAKGTGGAMIMGYYHGLDNVEYDNKVVKVHRGEAILPAQEAQQWREGKSSGGTSAPIINIAKMEVRKDSDIKEVAYELARLIEKEAMQYA